jgi:hypothetical protein
MYLLNNYSKRIGAFIASESKSAYARAITLALVIVALVTAAILHFGAPVMNGRPWDVPALLDGGWRIANGQVPYRDFFNHHGPLALYLTALGMKLGTPSLASIDYGSVILMSIVSLIALFVLCRRTSALYCFIFSLLIALLVVAPRPLGDPYDFTDHALIFTRFGDALLILLAIIFFLPLLKNSDRTSQLPDMALAGLIITLLIFNKINYAMLGIGFGVASVALRCITLRQWLGALASVAVVTGIILSLSGISLSQMLGAYSRVAVGFQGGFRIKVIFIQLFKTLIWLPFLLLLISESAFGKQGEERLVHLRRWAIPLLIFGAAVLLLASNTQTTEAPVLAFAALYSAELIRRDSRSATDGFFKTTRQVGACCIVLLFTLPTLCTDVLAIRHSIWLSHRNQFVTSPDFKNSALADFRFDPAGTRWLYSKQYMESIAEGMDLMRRHSKDLRILPIVFTNPFNFGLKIAPPKGGIIFWDPVLFQFHNSFPPLQTLLGDANALLISADDQSLQQAYGAQWKNLQLEKVEQTAHYILLKIPAKSAN